MNGRRPGHHPPPAGAPVVRVLGAAAMLWLAGASLTQPSTDQAGPAVQVTLAATMTAAPDDGTTDDDTSTGVSAPVTNTNPGSGSSTPSTPKKLPDGIIDKGDHYVFRGTGATTRGGSTNKELGLQDDSMRAAASGLPVGRGGGLQKGVSHETHEFTPNPSTFSVPNPGLVQGQEIVDDNGKTTGVVDANGKVVPPSTNPAVSSPAPNPGLTEGQEIVDDNGKTTGVVDAGGKVVPVANTPTKPAALETPLEPAATDTSAPETTRPADPVATDITPSTGTTPAPPEQPTGGAASDTAMTAAPAEGSTALAAPTPAAAPAVEAPPPAAAAPPPAG